MTFPLLRLDLEEGLRQVGGWEDNIRGGAQTGDVGEGQPSQSTDQVHMHLRLIALVTNSPQPFAVNDVQYAVCGARRTITGGWQIFVDHFQLLA